MAITIGFLFPLHRRPEAQALTAALASHSVADWTLLSGPKTVAHTDELGRTVGSDRAALVAAVAAATSEVEFRIDVELPDLGTQPLSVASRADPHQVDVMARFDDRRLFDRRGEAIVARRLLDLAASLVTEFRPELAYVGRDASGADLLPATLRTADPSALAVYPYALWPAAAHRFDGGDLRRHDDVSVRVSGRRLG